MAIRVRPPRVQTEANKAATHGFVVSERRRKASPLEKASVKERSATRKEEVPGTSGEGRAAVAQDATTAAAKDRNSVGPPPLPVPIITFNI